MPAISSLLTLGALLASPIPHQWTDASKQAVGTAFGHKSSKVWFTIGRGVLNEVYFPRIDRAQVGDSQLLFANIPGAGFLEEKRDFTHELAHPPAIPRALIRARWGEGGSRVEFVKEVLTDPERAVLRIRYRFAALPQGARVYILHKPTADNDGAHDVGRVAMGGVAGRDAAKALYAWDSESERPAVQALVTTAPITRASIGIVGESDGWQDLARSGKMVHEIRANGPGNLALTAEVPPVPELEIAIGFGYSPDEAFAAAAESLRSPWNETRRLYDEGWLGYIEKLAEAPWLEALPQGLRQDLLWNAAVIKAHEDKSNRGAIIASLSIPRLPDGGGAADGKDTGGYHLVWPRDLFKSALALLRLGDAGTALHALRFMSRMEVNGRISQNAWVDGRPFWQGEQLDQEAFPVLLAFELRRAGAELGPELEAFVARRVARLQRSSGATGQERWEEAGGFSPNTLAVMAAALSRAGEDAGARRLLGVLLEKTVSREGPLSRKPYFLRIAQNGRPDAGETLQIANGGPAVPEYRVLDGGFLEWLRWFPAPEKYFGAAGGELAGVIRDTLRLYDDPANGVADDSTGIPLYRRYAGDAYGIDRRGGPWPILTAERALPELATNPKAALRYLRAVRELWGPGDLCPEQVETPSRRGARPVSRPMRSAASPLVWCHAEMIELAHTTALRMVH